MNVRMKMMTRGAAGLVALCAVCGLAMPVSTARAQTGAGAVSASAKATIDQFLRIRAPQGAILAPDGTLYVRDFPDGVTQLYRVPKGVKAIPTESAKWQRLTSYADGISGASMSPDGKRILITHGVGGNENFQIASLDPATDRITELTTDPKVQYAINNWLDDSSGFVFSGNQDSPTDFYLYLFDFAKGKAERILAKEGSWSLGDITVDRKKAVVSKYNSASDTAVFELTIADGTLKEITIRPEGGGTAACDVVGFMPGAEQVLLISDARDGIQRLYLKDLKTGSVTSPIPDLERFELDGAGFNDDRSILAVAVNEDGYGTPHFFAVPGFAKLPSPKMERGVVSAGGTFRGKTVVWSQNNARTPGVAFATELVMPQEAKTPVTRQLTEADTQGIDLQSFPLPDLIKYKTFDGKEIPAFVFFPPGYDKSAKKPIPFICLYHGGPEGQHRPTFSAQQQFFLSQGFGIILPNVRGSTGYGRAFQMLDDYKNRWDSVKDGVYAAKWLVDNGYSAPGKMTTFGGSYGGYMSVACLVEDTQSAEKEKRAPFFGAGVNIVGVTNLKTFLEKTSGYRRKLREVEYGPLTDPEFLLSASPGMKIDAIRVPMFIAHGFNDPRVPVEEAMQLSVALKDRALKDGKPELMPQLLVFPDEGHGFAKLDNRLLFAKQTTSFMKRTIGK